MMRLRWMVAMAVAGAASCTVAPSDDGFGSAGPPVLTSGVATTDDSVDGSSGAGTADGSGDDSASATGGLDTTGSADSGQTTSSCEGAPGAAALGTPCIDGCDCASGNCFAVSLGAACSECISDAQCMAGGGAGTCSIDPSSEPLYARCTSGEQGVMCQPGSGGCQPGLICAQLIDTMGFIPDYFCSQCATTADCPGGQTCVPVVEIEGVLGGGYLHCVAPGSLADGELCPLLPSGEGDGSVCASGRCAVTDVGGLGVADLGVCSPCATNADCAGGQTCQGSVIDETGATPAMCA